VETIDLGKEAKLRQLERILQSRAMQGSESLKSFLKYVSIKSIDESTDQVKEYTIATEVFGRSNDFSPRSDSVVRVQASRLRQKLQDYYSGEGRSDSILIELPKGHYYPVFSLVTGATESQPEHEHLQKPLGGSAQKAAHHDVELTASNLKDRKWVRALGGAVVLLASAVVMLAISNIKLRPRDGASRPQNHVERFGPVWQTFLENDDPTLLVLSNPAVYRFTNPKDSKALLKNSVTLAPKHIQSVIQTVGDKFMIKHSGGRLVISTDEYTGMGEAIGLARMTRLFHSAERNALLKQSRTISPEDLRNHNVILLGSVWVNEWSGKLPIKEDFRYTSAATIENLNPQAGEEREYSPDFDLNGQLIEDYGLITVKPNIQYRNTVMVIAGIHSEGTEAAAEYITNPDYLSNLTDRLRQLSDPSSLPKYYQVLLRVGVDRGMPTTITLVTVHELKMQDN
jgi:hypothetical protein